ncbi:MAG: DUF4190 domain-containing protein [Lachnospiraceae bacterium]|nr:DUF4190 domain-containing protein [Lachnospiraceae bacterium]
MEFETPQYNERERAADRLATASLILGIISLFSTLCCCPFVFSAIGIVLALLSKGAEKVLRPRAKTGLILSAVGMGVSVILMVFMIAFPIFMYKTNPMFRENFREQMEKSLDQDEELFRQIYGDETYEQFRKMIEEGDL